VRVPGVPAEAGGEHVVIALGVPLERRFV
jgi:hypothetical protein